MDQISSLVAERGPVLVSVAVLLAGVFLFSTLRTVGSGKGASKIPLVGEELGNNESRRQAFISGAKDIYSQGYKSFRDKAFRLTGVDGERIVLPRHLLEEAKKVPDDVIDINKAFEKVNEMRYTGLGGNQVHTDFLIHTIRSDLTRGLSRINDRLSAEATKTVADILGPCEDWKSVVVYQELLTMVAVVSGNIFLGPDLCHSPEWIVPAIKYTVDIFTAIGKLKQWRWWTRPIGQYFIPELKSVKQHRINARAWLRPVIADRRRQMNSGKKDMPDDMLQWMMDKAPEYKVSDDELSLILLNLSLAAIHTTTLTTCLVLYDLVVRPDLIKDLRHEIKTVLAENNGVLTTHALYEMKLLDSVMKESQRTNPGSLVRFIRSVEKPITLSDGTHLPAGSTIEAPHGSIVNDPALYSNPETFDPHRFSNIRNGTAADPMEYQNKEWYQFVTVTKDFMAFGYGRHACPGRYFAANEIKLLLARIISQYDIRMPDGVTERYANIDMGVDSMPDPTKEILFRKIRA